MLAVCAAAVTTGGTPPRPAAAQAGVTDLGTLGGDHSEATAVDGGIVVGWSETVAGFRHAFAYDTANPQAGMVDLGTLGGANSEAVAISGTIVVGEAQTAGSHQAHAFAYDLSAPDDGMLDLGTLATLDGASSAAVAIDGTTVVGWSEVSSTDSTHHAFAADLSRSPITLTDLGPGEAVAVAGSLVGVADGPNGALYRLGAGAPEPIDISVEDDSATGAVPTAIDGSRVVGWAWSETPDNRTAFVYDAAHPELGVQTDVFAARPAVATAISGGVVAAAGVVNGSEHVLARDVADPLAVAHNLGPGSPAAVSGTVIVGRTAGGVAFAADMTDRSPALEPLPAPPGPSAATDVDETTVVGNVTTTGGATHAATWTLFNDSIISVNSRPAITWGKAAVVKATLTTTGSTDGVSGAVLRLMTRRVGTSRWRTAARATTDGNGRAAFTIRPTSTVDLRVGHPGSVVARSAISDVRRLIVRTAVRATLSEQRIDPGDAARLSGVVKPDRAGRRVILQGFRRTGWEKLKSEVVSSTGRFRFRIRPDRGWYSYRAFVRADGDRGWGASPLRTLRVERAVPVTRELSRLPNVVVILSDDQRPETLQHMKYVQSLLVRKGVSFTKAMVPTALCCPSRATILSGRYAHNTGVYSNGGIDGRKVGGWYGFHRSGAEARTLPVALSARGYRTGLIGKYLNYFGAYAPGGYSPPGWHTFLATTRNHGSYYHYELTNGEEFGSAAEDYSTDVYAARAARFIRTTRSGRPLFLYFTPYGPHAPYLPAPRHTGAWEGQLSLYDAPSVHDDLSGKPAYLQGLPEVPAEEVLRRQTRQQESLMAVDEAVSKLVTALRDTNRLRNTLVVFLSDNGYLWGDHRLVGKDKPYDPALRIPMVLRWGARVPAGGVDTRLALNVDLATTIARATQTRYASDGVNLLGAHRRHGFLLEAAAGYGGRPAYCGWRTRRWMFAQYATGERELYDLAADPHELHNLADDPAYADRLAALRSLAVQRCRPTPPGFSW